METKTLIQLLGQKVRALRTNRGWSQEDLAERCGRHFTYIGRIERGEQNVTVEVLNDVASALSVSIADLLAVDQPRLLTDWKVAATDLVEAVSRGFRAQVDVKGKLAELMLYRELEKLKKQGEIQSIGWVDEDGRPDFIVKWKERQVVIECKNVRSPDSKRKSKEPIRVELQKDSKFQGRDKHARLSNRPVRHSFGMPVQSDGRLVFRSHRGPALTAPRRSVRIPQDHAGSPSPAAWGCGEGRFLRLSQIYEAVSSHTSYCPACPGRFRTRRVPPIRLMPRNCSAGSPMAPSTSCSRRRRTLCISRRNTGMSTRTNTSTGCSVSPHIDVIQYVEWCSLARDTPGAERRWFVCLERRWKLDSRPTDEIPLPFRHCPTTC